MSTGDMAALVMVALAMVTVTRILKAAGLRVGYVPQKLHIDPTLPMTVRRFLDLPARVLSQGQRRRVGLARLFLEADRKLWILDEPFTALDVAAVAELTSTLSEHCAAGGMVVLTTHQDAPFAKAPTVLDLAEVAC